MTLAPIALATAAIAASAAGLGSCLRGKEEPGYRWLQWWAPRQHRVTVVVVIGIHAVVGLLATVAGLALSWYPLGEALWPLNALLYAGVGEALFRADWSGFFLDAATPANSLLAALIRERHEELYETVTQRHLPIFLSKLDDSRLLQLVTQLIERRFADADEVTLASKIPLLTALNIAGAALEGKLGEGEGAPVTGGSTGMSTQQRRRDALTWLKNRALREIQDAEYRVPGFDDVNAALTAIGKDLSPGPELLP
ncbi:MAG: hypothetical protein ACRDYX_16330 [Egibacteraceae bacterium]